MGRGKMIYATVLYDFEAERHDELVAKAGESIIIIAQSTDEWFVAKPIGRLGGPGLIPITYIEIKDIKTGKAVQDPAQAIQAAGVPQVAEWKRMAAEYKAGSISLGKFDDQAGRSTQSLEQGMDRLSLRNGQMPENGNSVSAKVSLTYTTHTHRLCAESLWLRTRTVILRRGREPIPLSDSGRSAALLLRKRQVSLYHRVCYGRR